MGLIYILTKGILLECLFDGALFIIGAVEVLLSHNLLYSLFALPAVIGYIVINYYECEPL